jgi:hypothetical protein
MRFSILFLAAAVWIAPTSNTSFTPEYYVVLDSAKGEGLLNQCSRSVPEKIDAYFTLSQEDIRTLEDNFLKIKKIKAKACCQTSQQVTSLEKFAFQYMGVTVGNRRFIYLNAFKVNNKVDFETFYKDWKSSPVVMCDGGDHYWGALFDLGRQKFTQLAFNGII